MPPKLENGQDTISTAKVITIDKKVKDPHDPESVQVKKYLRQTWRICIDGKTLTRQTTMVKTRHTTHADVRDRSRKQAAELLQNSKSTWKLSDPVGDYITKVSRKQVEQDTDLRPRTKQRYQLALTHIAEAWEGMTIKDSLGARAPELLYNFVASAHGAESARQVIHVVSKRVYREMRKDRLTEVNPVVEDDFKAPRVAESSRVAKAALTRVEYNTVLAHLLLRDALRPIPPGTDRRGTSIAQHRNAINLTLLQMGTGLRISEVLALQWRDLWAIDGNLVIPVFEDTAKTRKYRSIAIMNSQVRTYFMALYKAADPGDYVISTPADPAKPWRSDNAGKVSKLLFKDLANVLGIPTLAEPGVRTHVWRRTLNNLTLATVPEALRTEYFGHHAVVNRAHYTDLNSIDVATSFAGKL